MVIILYLLTGGVIQIKNESAMSFQLLSLPYAKNALEPLIFQEMLE